MDTLVTPKDRGGPNQPLLLPKCLISPRTESSAVAPPPRSTSSIGFMVSTITFTA